MKKFYILKKKNSKQVFFEIRKYFKNTLYIYMNCVPRKRYREA